MTCNALAGYYRCGRTILSTERYVSFGVHTNRGNQPHTFATEYQCSDCTRKQEALYYACAPQSSWRERRRAAGLSLGQMAERLGLALVDYSQMESLRLVASEQVRLTVEQILQECKQ